MGVNKDNKYEAYCTTIGESVFLSGVNFEWEGIDWFILAED
jgi:hypothetical protein